MSHERCLYRSGISNLPDESGGSVRHGVVWTEPVVSHEQCENQETVRAALRIAYQVDGFAGTQVPVRSLQSDLLHCLLARATKQSTRVRDGRVG